LMSDVAAGSILSGGVDSRRCSGVDDKKSVVLPLNFSVGYAEDEYSELPYARVVSKHLNSIHHEVLVGQQEFFDSCRT